MSYNTDKCTPPLPYLLVFTAHAQFTTITRYWQRAILLNLKTKVESVYDCMYALYSCIALHFSLVFI